MLGLTGHGIGWSWSFSDAYGMSDMHLGDFHKEGNKSEGEGTRFKCCFSEQSSWMFSGQNVHYKFAL